MAKHLMPQDLNADILRLVREKGALSEPDLHGYLAQAYGACEGGPGSGDIADLWRFSASVNLARRRLVRYGLLAPDCARRLTITGRGERFLAGGFRRLDANTRRVCMRTDDLDARLAQLEAAFLRSGDAS